MATIFITNYSGDYGYLYEFMADAYETLPSDYINTNKTNVTVDIYLRRINSSENGAYNFSGTGWAINIDGTAYSGSSTWDTRYSTEWKFLGTATKTVEHATDGSKVCSISASHTGNSATGLARMGNASGSGSLTLTTIPRQANFLEHYVSGTGLESITVKWDADARCDAVQYSVNDGAWVATSGLTYTITGLQPNKYYNVRTRIKRQDSQKWTESGYIGGTTKDIAKVTGANNFNSNANPYMTFTNPAGATVNLVLEVGGNYIRRDGITGSGGYTFSLTNAERNLLYSLCPNSTTLAVRYTAETTVNGTGKYWNWLDKTMTVVNSNPIFNNFQYEDTNEKTKSLTGSNSSNPIFIKKYSNLKITIPTNMKMTTQNYATPVSYNMIVGSQSANMAYSASGDVTKTFNKMNASEINVYAIDSRDNQTRVGKSLNVLDYVECVLSSVVIDRENGIGETVKIRATGTYNNINFGTVRNTIKTIQYRKKENSTSAAWSSWKSIIGLFNISGGTFSNVSQNQIPDDVFTFGTEYLVEVKITDELSESTKQVIVGSGKVLMSAVKGKGMCFGGLYDETVGGPLQINGQEVLNSLARYNGGDLDPNTTLHELILTQHANTPEKGTEFYYIKTFFYASKSIESHRSQIAIGYRKNNMYQRFFYQGSWSQWVNSGNPDCITLRTTRHTQSFQNAWTFYEISNMNTYSQIGNSLRASSSGNSVVVIGPGVSKVRISGGLTCNNTTGADRSVGILKNNEEMFNVYIQNVTTYHGFTIPSMVIYVSEGDVIRLGIAIGLDGTQSEILSASLTVEVVE